MAIGERDGPAALREATTILVKRHLPAFPRQYGIYETPAWLRWRLSPDVVAAFLGLHSPTGDALPYSQTELLGYPIEVDEAAPEWTLELLGEDLEKAAVVVSVVVNDATDEEIERG
jgi:hypothetical protein